MNQQKPRLHLHALKIEKQTEKFNFLAQNKIILNMFSQYCHFQQLKQLKKWLLSTAKRLHTGKIKIQDTYWHKKEETKNIHNYYHIIIRVLHGLEEVLIHKSICYN